MLVNYMTLYNAIGDMFNSLMTIQWTYTYFVQLCISSSIVVSVFVWHNAINFTSWFCGNSFAIFDVWVSIKNHNRFHIELQSRKRKYVGESQFSWTTSTVSATILWKFPTFGICQIFSHFKGNSFVCLYSSEPATI